MLETLILKDFRNYTDTKVHPKLGINLFVGANGVGKSNLLESIFTVSIGKSPWASDRKEMIRFENPYALIRSKWSNRDECAMQINRKGRNEILLNNKRVSRLSSLVGNFPTVIAGPQEIELVKGSPRVRRRLLDLHISQLSREYLTSSSNYQKLIKGRNALLKKIAKYGSKDYSYLISWDKRLVEDAELLVQTRIKFLENLSVKAGEAYSAISNQNSEFRLEYKSTYKLDSDFFEQLERSREKDIEIGETRLGPHRDDFDIFLDGRNLREFGSWGECRTASLALVLGTAKAINQKFDRPPLLLLDDCFASLDIERAQALLSYLNQFGQSFLTTPIDYNAFIYNSKEMKNLHIYHFLSPGEFIISDE